MKRSPAERNSVFRFHFGPIRRLLAFVGLLLPAVTFAADVPARLAADGKTSFVIVTGTEPAVEEQTAAQWLSETLEQVTATGRW